MYIVGDGSLNKIMHFEVDTYKGYENWDVQCKCFVVYIFS